VFFDRLGYTLQKSIEEKRMKTLKILIVAGSLALFGVACGNNAANNQPPAANTARNAAPNTAPSTAPANAATPDELAGAKKIFTEKCVGCHKENGTGGEKEIDGVKIKVPDFTSERLKAESDAEFVKIITNGEKEEGMPAFKGKVSDQEINDLVKLIRKEFQKK
jgi:mono/diheme cytochrome c family protein